MLSMNCLKRVLRFEGRICDCAVLWKNEGRVAAIELKGGQNANIRQLVEQLQGGLNLLDDLIKGQSVSEVMPILLYSGDREIDSALAKRRVTFRGDKRRIIIGPCGFAAGWFSFQYPAERYKSTATVTSPPELTPPYTRNNFSAVFPSICACSAMEIPDSRTARRRAE